MTGIERLRRVRAFVPDVGRNSRKKLKQAAIEFDAAFRADGQDWPQRFRLKADALRAILTRHGATDETIDRLAAGEIAETVASLRLFCDEAERVVTRNV
ncbi:MAG: hypothetical protein WBC44_04760 [Planctomycetaceae bacterium]